jgi:hypothetical protein
LRVTKQKEDYLSAGLILGTVERLGPDLQE